MTKTVILGGGMIGSAMAMDLAKDPGFEVTVADARQESLDRIAARWGVPTLLADLSDPRAVHQLASGFDLVLGALPSVFGFASLRAVIEAGRPFVDISFMAENALELDGLARERGVVAVVDCGVAPGTSNLLAGYAASQLDRCDNIEIYVGGLPAERRWPFEYKAGFAPSDVIEEYTRPARLVEHGQVVVREALSEPELLDFPEIGSLEAFNTDGLRSLIFTLKAPFMKEKTLRYPGHIALMRAFRETGLFSKDLIEVNGQPVRPLEVTAALLFPKWTFAEGEADITVLRVRVEGRRGEERLRYAWDLLDRYHAESGLRSMSRTTAFPAVIVARLLAQGRFRRPGVHPPEILGAEPGLADAVLGELLARGVAVRASTQRLPPS
ncbi:MAG TPA: saccharopine dehydrogenase C-terminal domain-containing protein [Vicinamibacteria bacterium]|nr:saccharopine dehydrogenase C-terminal domain-containing protein [Vicinamibacteria bacterium]